jgi:hypothetical protein
MINKIVITIGRKNKMLKKFKTKKGIGFFVGFVTFFIMLNPFFCAQASEDTVSAVVTVIGHTGTAAHIAAIGYKVTEMGPDIYRAYIGEQQREDAMEDIMDDVYPNDDEDDNDENDEKGSPDESDNGTSETEDTEEEKEEEPEDDEIIPPEEEQPPEQPGPINPCPPVPMPYVDPETGKIVYPEWDEYIPIYPAQ